MPSFQDVVNTAYRIRESASDMQRRAVVSADALTKHGGRLAQVTRGSRTGQEAVREAAQASRAMRDCSAKLLRLQSDIDAFIREVQK